MIPADQHTASLSAALVDALSFMSGEQLPNGEIPNYRNMPNGSWEYCFSPLVSAYMHEALGCFDAFSPWLDTQALEQVDASARPAVTREATRIRRQIRRYLAWQESPEGSWRFFGAGSSLAPDVDTTACGAAALIEPRHGGRKRDYTRSAEALRRLCGSIVASRSGIGPEIEEDLAATGRAGILRYFALTGFDTDGLMTALLEDLARRSSGPCRMLFLYALVRACAQGRLSEIDDVRMPVLEEVLEQYDPARRVSGPLTAALAVHVLTRLGHEDSLYPARIDALLDWLTPVHGRRFERLGEANCGSAALTTAFLMAALAMIGSVCS
jgi:hypothetical protein